MGLDERSPDQLVDLGLGLGLDRRGVEALPQLRPPHLHEHPRQGPRPRLRDHADRPAPEVASGLPAAAALQPGAGGVLRVGRRLARPRLRGDQEGREVQGAARRELKGMAAQGAASRSSRTTSPGRSSARWRTRPCTRASPPAGGRRCASARRGGCVAGPSRRATVLELADRELPLDAGRGLHRERRPQRVGLRDHLLRALPRPDVHLQPGRGRRTSRAAASTSASCSARPTSRAARSSTSPAATSATRSSTTSTPTCRAPATPRSRRG